MLSQCETRRAGGAAGLDKSSLLSRLDNREIARKSPAIQPQNRLRLQFLAARLHELGPKPLFYFFAEIEAGEDLRGGDGFLPAVHLVPGERP